LIVALASVSVAICQQDIVKPGAKGTDVVEAVCNIIEASCVFPDDKLFTRRLAYVESFDGEDTAKFPPGYYGGIWQVDKNMFDVTQSPPAASYLAPTIADVRTKLGIDWPTVTWSDLTKPLHSAVGARLYLQYQSRNELNGIPRATVDQAQFWVNYYRPAGDPDYFVNLCNRLSSDCINAGTDIVFVLDSSGSIGSSDFQKIKSFVKDVIQAFDIGFDQTRVGVVQYSTTVSRPFDLNDYGNKADMLAAVDRIAYTAGGTNTHLALDMMTNVSFTAARGARPMNEAHPRIGIVLTDGESTLPSLTVEAAKRMHDANILAFAIGVGTSLDIVELTAIASEPTCTYLILLNSGFAEIDSLVSVIEKKACEAPFIISPDETDRISSTLPPGGSQNCQIKVSANGTTVKLAVGEGAVVGDIVSFYTSTVTYPSEAFYDQKADAWLNKQAVVYIPVPGSINTTVFCNYKGNGQAPTNISIGTFPGNTDWCQSQPCQNDGTCSDLNDDFVCLCKAGFNGVLCEKSDAPVVSPAPFVSSKFVSSMSLSSTASVECSDTFTSEFRNSAANVITRVNEAVRQGVLCAESKTLSSIAGQIQVFFIGNMGQATFFTIDGLNAPETATVRSVEACTFEVALFVQNITNWRQPVIPSIFGCPTVTVQSISFSWDDTKWSCFI